MKSQQIQTTTQINIDAFKCISNTKAIQFCINSKCQNKSSFICINDQCNCQEDHLLCAKANIKAVLKVINYKIAQTLSIKDKIEDIIEKAINELSELRQKLLIEVDTKFKYSQLTSLQKQFLEVSQSELQPSYFNGFKLENLWKIIRQKQFDEQKMKSKMLKQVKKIIETSNQYHYKTIKEINDLIKTYQQGKFNSSTQLLEKIKVDIINQVQNPISKSILNEVSSIITTAEQSKILIGFFSKGLRKISRVFVASQHNFSITKYYEICEKLTQTIVICRTDKDKIIGGYTPLQFDPSKGAGFVKDEKSETFLFSVSNNDKFPLLRFGQAICRHKDKSRIQFGKDEFNIGNNANIYATAKTDTNYNSFSINKNYTQSGFEFSINRVYS